MAGIFKEDQEFDAHYLICQGLPQVLKFFSL